MISFFNYITNSSIFHGVFIYLNTIQAYLCDSVKVLREPDQLTVGALEFDDFQLKLLKIFFAFLILNLFLIFVAWKYYGRDIHERFIKPTSNREIEELRASVSKLKLPKEHTPRI